MVRGMPCAIRRAITYTLGWRYVICVHLQMPISGGSSCPTP